MQLRADQLPAQLARGALKAIYTLHGDEPLQAQEAADAIRAAARAQGCSERLVFVQSGAHADWSAVLGALASRGLFDDKRLIEIRVPSGKPGKDGGEALIRYAQEAQQSSDTVTLVHLPRMDRTALNSDWFGALDAAGASIRIDTPSREQLLPWLVARLAKQGKRVSAGADGQAALNLFADRVEGNLLAAHQELQKLALLHEGSELTLAQVDAAVGDVARFEISQWVAAVMGGQTARMLRVLASMQASGESAVAAHYPLAEELRAIARMQAALAAGEPPPVALRTAGVWGLQAQRVERLAPRLPAPAVQQLVLAAQQCDGVLKGLRLPDWPQDAWDALRQLALAIQTVVNARAAPPPRTAAAR